MPDPHVWPGDMWEDKDARLPGRHVRVNRVDGKYAYCHEVSTGKPVRLLLRRMGKGSGTTGWRPCRCKVLF